MTNEAIVATGGEPQTIVNNFLLQRFADLSVHRRDADHGTDDRAAAQCRPTPRTGSWPAGDGGSEELDPEAKAAEARGLKLALYGFLGVLAVVLLATVPPGAPLRDPSTGSIVGNTPFMDSLLFIIAAFFLVAGICYGAGAGTIKSSNDVVAAIAKTFSSLGGMVLMFLMIAQFLAYFNYSNMPRVIAVALAELLERAAIPALPLLILFILVIVVLDFILPGVIPKWAIFAPIFIPIFIRLGVGPQTVMAAYRIGDSPVNTLTPLMVYFPFIVTIAQRYRKDAGVGTIVAMMLPYAVIMLIAWIVFFAIWFALNIPLGPGYLPRAR
jgi:aminobenzoyl-glutamate transport protein